jgi:hypothetical protein
MGDGHVRKRKEKECLVLWEEEEEDHQEEATDPQEVLPETQELMHLCRYEETIRDYIFPPKNYGRLSVHRQPHRFCNDCKLKPCITIEHLDEIATLQFEEHRMHDKAREAGKKV